MEQIHFTPHMRTLSDTHTERCAFHTERCAFHTERCAFGIVTVDWPVLMTVFNRAWRS
jgi:hypothetical protein